MRLIGSGPAAFRRPAAPAAPPGHPRLHSLLAKPSQTEVIPVSGSQRTLKADSDIAYLRRQCCASLLRSDRQASVSTASLYIQQHEGFDPCGRVWHAAAATNPDRAKTNCGLRQQAHDHSPNSGGALHVSSASHGIAWRIFAVRMCITPCIAIVGVEGCGRHRGRVGDQLPAEGACCSRSALAGGPNHH